MKGMFKATLIGETKRAYSTEVLRRVMESAEVILTQLGLEPVKEYRPRSDKLEANYPITWTVYGTAYTVRLKLLVLEPKAQVEPLIPKQIAHPALRALYMTFQAYGFAVRGSRFHSKAPEESGTLHMEVIVTSEDNIFALLTVSLADDTAVSVEEL